MNELLEWMEYIEDNRQQTKVRDKLKDIIVIVLFATLVGFEKRNSAKMGSKKTVEKAHG